MAVKKKVEVKTKEKKRERRKGGWIVLFLLVVSITLLCFIHGDEPVRCVMGGLIIGTFVYVVGAILLVGIRNIGKILLYVVFFLISFLIGFTIIALLEMAGFDFLGWGTAGLIERFSANPAEGFGGAIFYAMIPFGLLYILKGIFE
jgi:hypothetical protein